MTLKLGPFALCQKNKKDLLFQFGTILENKKRLELILNLDKKSVICEHNFFDTKNQDNVKCGIF